MKKQAHVFTVPLPYPQLPVTFLVDRDETEEKLHEGVRALFASEQFKKMGVVGDGGKFLDPVEVSTVFKKKTGTNFPDEFSKLLPLPTQEIIKRIFEGVRNGEQFPVVNGGLGDMEDCDAIVERKFELPDGGMVTKFFGCLQLFKGYPVKELVEGMVAGKAMISTVPREIILKSLVFKVALGLLFVFSRKRFFHYLRVYANIVYRGAVELDKKSGKNKLERELKRSMDAAINWEVVKTQNRVKGEEILTQNYHTKYPKELEFYMTIANIAEFVWFFLAHDTAYRFVVQDILGELDQGALYTSVRKEVNRLISIALSRFDRKFGKLQVLKYLAIKGIINVAFLSRKFRRLMKEFLTGLDQTKVWMDEDDWYFCLRRTQYNYRGMSLQERLKEAKRIDDESGNVSLQLVKVNDGKGNEFPAIKVILP